MADAVEFLLNNLNQLMIHHGQLIKNNKTQVEQLEKNVGFFKSFLKKVSSNKLRNDDTVKVLVRDIRNVIYDADDIIDSLVTELKTKNYFSRMLDASRHSGIISIAEQVNAICGTISEIYGAKDKFDLVNIAPGDGPDEEPLQAPAKNVVGFKDEMNAVIGYLSEQTEELDVITVVGMPGSGKTTLARMIFDDPQIIYEFPIRIWVDDVSNELTQKDLLVIILRKLSAISMDVMGKSVSELRDVVISHLQSAKFLIVLDDVWLASDWDRLKLALPKSNKKGKVLISSCNEEVGWVCKSVKLHSMSESESWELLQLEVFGETDKCPTELENVGKLIAKQCDGLPLALVTAGGILVRDDLASGNDMMARKTAWIKTCRTIPSYRNMKFFDILPVHLKLCFLYLAAFPYDYEIPVGELMCMWIAEGFIEQRIGIDLSLEECAEAYLEDLIRRNLVKVDQIKANGKAKTCRIHRMLHEFCKTEAGNRREDLLTEIKFSDGVFEPRIPELSHYRRLSINSNIIDFLSSKLFCPRARSLCIFTKDQVPLPTQLMSSIPAAFKLLRVLNAKPIIFTKLGSDMYHLTQFRYLALSFTDVKALPRAFYQFSNIQTLLVNTTSRILDVKPDILEFTKLRHFKTNASANLCKVGKTGEGGESLQSLGTISPESCTKELFNRARNLKKLGIRGRLSLLLDGKIGSLDNLAALKHLENLKLLNDPYPNLPSEGRLHSLPPCYKFPPTLKSLTLATTFLDWSQMSILGGLDKLQVLKLKNKAFMGRIWEANDGGFRGLQVLHIEKTDLGIWVASSHHFPQLRTLKLRNCDQLQEVPIELAGIPSLQLLDLYETKLAAASARRFLEKKQKILKERSQEFKLSMYPCS